MTKPSHAPKAMTILLFQLQRIEAQDRSSEGPIVSEIRSLILGGY